MATQRIDSMHDVTLKAPEMVGRGVYRCEARVGLTNGTLTDSFFTGEGPSTSSAERDAIRKAREAIFAKKIKYQNRQSQELE